jgi:lycopene cyclase domain-containing protein
VSYTALALAGVALAVLLDLVVLRTRLLTRRVFWTAYAIVLFFQLLTNGWLTGREVVTYDEDAILGPRLVYAPVEDLLFGFSLVVQTLAWWSWWGRRLRPGASGPAATAEPTGRAARGRRPAPPRADGSAPAR